MSNDDDGGEGIPDATNDDGEEAVGAALEGEVHDWSAFYDDEGRIYYYNSTSGESSWDPPEKFNPPRETIDAAEPEAEAATAQDGSTEQASADAAVDPATQETSDTAGAKNAWVVYQDDEGRDYYFNTVTEETTWDQPEGFEPSSSAAEGGGAEEGEASPVRAASPIAMDDDRSISEGDEPTPMEAQQDKSPHPDLEEKVDPAVKRLEDAQEALRQTDAIMEPGVLAHVTEVVTSEGGKPLRAIEALSESYFGETAACGLLGRWLADLKSQSVASDTTEQVKAFSVAADDIRETVQAVINRMSKERFTQIGGDSILKLSKSEAAFLTEMMVSSRWRKLLIDLSASNKDSPLLMYCLEQISKEGHHREIARRINQSDHFTVFNAMLGSELSVIGKIAVSSCKGTDTSISIAELVSDLQRTCTSTAYTYIYAVEVLRQLIVTSKQKKLSDPDYQSSLFSRAIRKWERLNEDLQSAIVDPSAAAGSTALFRKRRLDVAVTISELHQRQRRRVAPSDDGSTPIDPIDDVDQRPTIESAVLEFLRRYSLGTRVDDRILDRMLPKGLGGDSTNLVGKLMIRRPLTVKALLGYMYRPGVQRMADIVTKNKCARLVAFAVHAAEDEALLEAKQVDDSISLEHDEVALTRMLLEGSRLCEMLENMVSFVVTGLGGKSELANSPGQQLCSLAVKCTPVAQGVAIWAREVTKGNEFVTSASYPTLSPSILSLIRVLFLNHPFIRDDALELALCFLKHSNSEISYQKMNEIKEQSLRLLLFLCIRGEAPTVLGQVIKLLTQPGTSHLDASLIRYFVSGLLEIVRVPLSVPFARLVCALLKAPSAVEAVKTSYFVEGSRKQLDQVIRYLGDLEANGTHGKLTPEDASLFKSVASIYATG